MDTRRTTTGMDLLSGGQVIGQVYYTPEGYYQPMHLAWYGRLHAGRYPRAHLWQAIRDVCQRRNLPRTMQGFEFVA